MNDPPTALVGFRARVDRGVRKTKSVERRGIGGMKSKARSVEE